MGDAHYVWARPNMRGMRGRHTDCGNDVCSTVGDSGVVDAELHAELEAGVDVLELLDVCIELGGGHACALSGWEKRCWVVIVCASFQTQPIETANDNGGPRTRDG